MLKELIKNERGAEMTEYILIIALIAIACIFAIKMFGFKIRGAFISAGNKLHGACD